MVGLSETRRPGSGKTSSKGFTYYWSSMSNGHNVKGVAIGVSSRVQPSVVKVIPVDERIMRFKAEAQFRLHVCCCSVCSYRGV